MTTPRVTVIGAGLAGLSAAVALVEAGVAVTLVDAAKQAGGRCRSYHDPQLGLTIDNGNHLVLSGNNAVARFRRRIGATRPLAGPAEADYAFADLAGGERWTVRINAGRLPWWLLAASRRVPGSRAREYLPIARLLRARDGRVRDHVRTDGPVWTRLLEPILLAALNTAPAEASARLAGAVLRETVARGGRAMRPRIAEPSLGEAFIEPALGRIRAAGGSVTLGRPLRGFGWDGDRVASLDWGGEHRPLPDHDGVILATPPWTAAALVPGLSVPDEHRAIVNGHFACAPPASAPAMLGLLGGTAEWLFAFPNRISVTVSGAEHLIDRNRESLAAAFWADIRAAYGLAPPMPRWQIVKEKRATFAAMPAQDGRRPAAATRWRNLLLAGDWTDTGLPSTIEGALRSGEVAARLATAMVRG